MTLTDKDAQRRIWCMFGDSDIESERTSIGRLVYVEDGHKYPYQDNLGLRFKHCRECTPEELAKHGLTQPPRPWAERVTQWAIDRNIIPGSTAERQFLKLAEEVGELSEALQNKDRKKIMDAIGDIAVTANNIAELSEMTYEECCEAAWEQIKDRTGKLVNGVFVKEVAE